MDKPHKLLSIVHQGIYFQKLIFEITQHIIKFYFLQMNMYQNFYEIKGLLYVMICKIIDNLNLKLVLHT